MGLPAVVVVTEQFETLAKVVLKSQQVPDSVAVLVSGNPETISDDELARVARQVLEQSVQKLTQGTPGK
jgi:hypothetical protein